MGRNLMSFALEDLHKMDYRFYSFTKVRGNYRNVRDFVKDGKEYSAFIQTRSETSNSRYTVGIVLEAMEKCDYHIAWFENEPTMFIIPCKRLLEIWKETEEYGEPCYSANGYQWRVDYYPNENKLTPQNTDRYSKEFYNIQEYAIEAPQMWKQRLNS